MDNIDHPFYCVWCGEVLPDKVAFEKHYKEEVRGEQKLSPGQVFDLVNNTKHY